MVRVIRYLIEYPHIKIHILQEEKYHNFYNSVDTARKADCARWFRAATFDLLGISSDRIISGSYVAKTIYLPREMGCAMFLDHALELKLLGRFLKQGARKYTCPHIDKAKKKKTVVVQDRRCPSTETAKAEPEWRCWSQEKINYFIAELKSVFPDFHIETAMEISDYNNSDTSDYACLVKQYSRADITIGLHGAAMVNTMYMKPGGYVLEIAGEFDGRMMPVCGLHGPFAAVFGLHHYLYYYDGVVVNSTLNESEVVKEFSNFYKGIEMRKHKNLYMSE